MVEIFCRKELVSGDLFGRLSPTPFHYEIRDLVDAHTNRDGIPVLLIYQVARGRCFIGDGDGFSGSQVPGRRESELVDIKHLYSQFSCSRLVILQNYSLISQISIFPA